MRLHHLRLSAFGPFAGTEQVDFDELCDAGLFLLTGPTGAGKTTILDAVCFALYGSVPGVRGVKALKSQHAGYDARPEVVLDFSVRERRFVIRRSPEWTRPKRRGTGFTTENASATLVETTSGSDHLLSSRAQEVGHLINELIGMQSTQFVQVAMLPQGDFQRFLRASSQDRHDVLQHLFRSDRYARIEDWVNDHSRDLGQRSDALRQEVVRTLDTAADRAATMLPDELDADALLAPEGPERALAWVDALVDGAAAAQAAARCRHVTAVEAATVARAGTADALQQVALQRRRAEAVEAIERLAAGAETAEQAKSALDADTRAARCHGLAAMLADSRTAVGRSARDLMAAMQDLVEAGADGPVGLDDPGGRDPLGLLTAGASADTLARREHRTRTTLARVEALLPREQELVDARHRATETRAQLGLARTKAARLGEHAQDLPAALAVARSEASALEAAAAGRAALSLELEEAVRRSEAVGAARACAGELERLEDIERGARDRALDARGRVQDLTARRLAGIAAELAGQLISGDACQVCGSTEHPAPAETLGDLVTETEQSAADTEHDAAAAAHAAAAGDVVRTRERLTGLRTAAGGVDVAAATALVEDLEGRLRGATAASEALATAQAAVERLETDERELTSSRHDLALRVASLEQALSTHEQQIEQLTAELTAAVDGETEADGTTRLAEQAERLSALADALARARRARCDHDEADARVRDLVARTDEAAREQGFADADALAAARLSGPERERLQRALADRAHAEARVRAVLDEEEIQGLAGRPDVDLEPLQSALQLAEDEAADAARVLHQREEAHTALGRQRERLSAALAAWAPVRADYLRAEGMSRLVRGMGHDNQLQMRLSAYVLATRLDQVVAAANERLGHMRDQRYLLQRTGRVARKGAQAGLGLEVVDQWTGDVRDPGTLSGGETFVVSLSLALGLADVVTQEAGGTEIETLFVDEGFGTLDAETLDDVMDRLDELRAGGRAVGVVSHVSELRNRIPTQLHVEKLRTGSTVAVRTAVG